MKLHKSFGLLVIAMIVPRILLRRGARLPAPVVGPAWEQFLGKVGHYSLYGIMGTLSATALGMGIFSGNGIPFFGFGQMFKGWAKVPAIAKQSVKLHRQIGKTLPYFMALHVGGYWKHLLVDGKNIIWRILWEIGLI